jgi:glycosyltransferase involved in cell wall biosynthesis
MTIVVPAGDEPADAAFSDLGTVEGLPYVALTVPRGLRQTLAAVGRLRTDQRTFREYFRRRRPDLVLVVTTALPAALVAARRERLPTIVYVGEVLKRSTRIDPIRGLGAATMSRLVARSADALVCCSQTVAGQFRSKGRASVTTIYPGVAVSGAGDREGFRKLHNIAEGALCIAVVGNVTAARGQDVVIRALPWILRAIPETVCLIAGQPHRREVDEQYARRLRELALALRVGHAVRYAGFVRNVEDVYAAADLVVNPATGPEAFGRVAAEALSAGRPVVASRIGAIPEVLQHERHALLVRPGDPEELAKAVVRLWLQPRLGSRLVQLGQAHVLASFSERAGIDAFCRVVDAVLDDGGG